MRDVGIISFGLPCVYPAKVRFEKFKAFQPFEMIGGSDDLNPDFAVKPAGRVSEPFGKLTTAWSSEDTQLCSFKVVFAFSRPVVVSLGRSLNHC